MRWKEKFLFDEAGAVFCIAPHAERRVPVRKSQVMDGALHPLAWPGNERIAVLHTPMRPLSESMSLWAFRPLEKRISIRPVRPPKSDYRGMMYYTSLTNGRQLYSGLQGNPIPSDGNRGKPLLSITGIILKTNR